MNANQVHPFRALAILLIAIPLAGCMTPSQTSSPSDVVEVTPVVESSPTGAIEVLPTPTAGTVAESTADPDASATSAPVDAEATPDPNWVEEAYGDAWTIGYPAGWTVNAGGAHEGALQVEGEYEGHSYALTFNYPIGILAENVEAWVEEVLLPLSLEQREAVVVSDVTVANTPAKQVLNIPTTDGTSTAHHVYIWRTDAKNPRLITITQTDGQPLDAAAMEQLLDRIVASVE